MIKAERLPKVKGRLALSWRSAIAASSVFAAMLCLSTEISRAQDSAAEGAPESVSAPDNEAMAPAPPASTEAERETPPPRANIHHPARPTREIDAQEFPARLRKWSTSHKVLLLEDISNNRPRPGKMLLMKDGRDDISALRVLKNYPGKFAAKITLPFSEPRLGQEYRVLKKIGDKMMQSIQQYQEDHPDLEDMRTDEELAQEVAPDDAELDRGIPPPGATPEAAPAEQAAPQGAASTQAEPEDEQQSQGKAKPLFNKDGSEKDDHLDPEKLEVLDEEEPGDLSVHEDLVIDPLNNILSMEFAQINGVDQSNNQVPYSSFGFRYGYNFWRNPALKTKSAQDMLTAEVGLFRYTIIGYVLADDSVTMTPLVLSGRYNLMLSENFTLFGYLGMMYNFVTADRRIPTDKVRQLQANRAVLGGGALYTIGPQWAVRADFGIDQFAIGAALKF